MRILNCRLTKSDSDIIETFGKQRNGTWHTGCDVTGTHAHSIDGGTVLAVNKSADGTSIVSVQYDKDTLLRYGNISSVYVSLGEKVMDGQQIGKVSKSIHFELCRKSATDTKFPVRVGSQTYYKIDPTPLLTLNEFLRSNVDSDKQRNYYAHPNPLNLSFDVFDEMNNGKG